MNIILTKKVYFNLFNACKQIYTFEYSFVVTFLSMFQRFNNVADKYYKKVCACMSACKYVCAFAHMCIHLHVCALLCVYAFICVCVGTFGV